jgi:tetratricopeptide (TPR) repeat protein
MKHGEKKLNTFMVVFCAFLFAGPLGISTYGQTQDRTTGQGRGEAVHCALTGQWNRVDEMLSSIQPDQRLVEENLLLGYANVFRKDWVKAWENFRTVDKSEDKARLLTWAKGLCQADPTSAMAFIFLGDAHARFSHYDEAIAALNTATSIDPKFPLAFDLRGLVSIVTGNLQTATQDLDGATALDPSFANALFERGVVNILTDSLDSAIWRLSSLLEQEPSFFLARNARGVAYMLRGNYGLGLADFDSVSLQVPGFTQARTNKTCGSLLRASDIFALADAKRVVELSPKGILGSITFIVGNDPASVQRATSRVADDIRRLKGNSPSVTDNFNDALGFARNGRDVIFQQTTPSLSNFIEPLDRNLRRFNDAASLLYKLADQKMPQSLNVSSYFTGAVIMDLDEMRQGRYRVLASHTFERLGEFGMKMLPGIVDDLKSKGMLPSSFSLSPILSGLPDFAKGIGSQVGRRQLMPTVDEWTHYLDGLNKASWATVGTMLGGPVGGRIASTVAGLAADIGRGYTESIFQHWAHNSVRNQMKEDYFTHVNSAIQHGLIPKSFSETFGSSLIKQSGFDTKTVAELDNYAKWMQSGGRMSTPIPTDILFDNKYYWRARDNAFNPHIDGKGVYLLLGPSEMDVQKVKQTDLSFLHGKNQSSSERRVDQNEPCLSYPFLILNPPLSSPNTR